MSRRDARLQADWKDAAVRCWRCSAWPATVVVDKKRRQCEACAALEGEQPLP